MPRRYEIIHSIHDRVFDLESYERTCDWGELMRDRACGYYVLIWPATPADCSSVDVAGPFEGSREARAAVLQLKHTEAASSTCAQAPDKSPRQEARPIRATAATTRERRRLMRLLVR